MREAMRQYAAGAGQSLNDIAASTEFQLHRQETTLEIAWAYGLARTWMIGLQLPVSMVNTQLQPNTQLTPVLSRFRGRGGDHLTPDDMKSHVTALVNNQLSSEGYDQLQTNSQNLIVGDVSVMSQVSMYQDNDWAVSLQQLARSEARRTTVSRITSAIPAAMARSISG